MSQTPIPAFVVPAYRGPMTISQILDRTFRLIRSNFWRLTGIGAVPAAFFLLIMAVMEAVFMVPVFRNFPKPPDPEALAHLFNPAIFAPMMLIYTVVSLCVFGLYLAAATHAATQADRGIPLSIREAGRAAFNRAGCYVWLLVLLYAITFLPALVIELATFGAVALLTLGNTNPNVLVFALTMLGMLLLFGAFIFGILMALRFSLAFPVCVVEGLTASAALKRSNQITKGAKGRIFVVLLVLYLACYAFSLVLLAVLGALGFIIALTGMAFNIAFASPLGYTAIGIVGLFALIGFMLYIAISWAALTTALAVIYHDQRLRIDAPPPQAGVPA